MSKWVEKFRVNLKVALLCLVVSATFWFFKAMNKTYADSVYIPIRIVALPDKHIKTGWAPSKVKVNVSALGWQILSRKFGFGLEPLEIELDGSKISRISSTHLFSLLENHYDDLEVNYLYDDEIITGYDIEESKTIRLKIDTEKLKPDYTIISSSIYPSRVKITGPSEALKNIPSTYLIKLKEVSLGTSVYKKTLDLEAYFHENIKLSEPTAIVDFEIRAIH